MKHNFYEEWESLTLANNFIFCKVMETEPELCRHLLEILLHIKISRLELVKSEFSMQETINSKSVRFDVYTEGDGKIYDIEIQTVNKKNLPKRSRYYQSMIDVDNIYRGQDYNELKTTYIIFLCLNDLFNRGLPVYSFENICQENKELKLDDGTHKIFFNAAMCDKMKSTEETAFFKFLQGNDAEDDFTNKLEERILKIKHNSTWRNQYMTFREQFCEEFEEAAEKGRTVAHSRDALNALKMGLTPEQAAQITELPLEKVLELQKQL